MSLQFDAMRNFSELDSQCMVDSRFATLVDSRYDMKKLILSNPRVGECALKALQEQGYEQGSSVYAYAERKITSFSKKANPNQARYLIPAEVEKVKSAVSNFMSAFNEINQDRSLKEKVDQHTEARKAFKKEVGENIRLVSAEMNQPSKAKEVFQAVLKASQDEIESLSVGAKTQAYLEYKISYVHAFE